MSFDTMDFLTGLFDSGTLADGQAQALPHTRPQPGDAGPAMTGNRSQHDGLSVTPSGDAQPQDLHAPDIDGGAYPMTTDAPSDLEAWPAATAGTTPTQPADGPPGPPMVPDSILANPIPSCSGCGRRAVVPGQPGRPAGLCFACWGKRR